MRHTLDSLFEQRTRLLASRQSGRRGLALSAAIHVVLFSSVLLAPLLASRTAEPIEFVPVQIVPIQALGVREPAPSPPARPRVKAPEPAPRPTEPEAEPTSSVPDSERQEKAQPSAPVTATTPALERREGSPLGSSLGTSSFGAAVGGFDNPDFVYGYYVDQMLAMISAQWRRPSLGGEIEATVYFRIHRDGQISELRVLRSSGYNSFDLAGLRAVELAAPFPKLPQSYRHGSLGVNLILR